MIETPAILQMPNPTVIAVPAFIVLILLEIFIVQKRHKMRYDPQDTMTSLLLGTGSTIAGGITGAFTFALALFIYDFRLFEIGYIWWAWPIIFVLDDFLYYWFHRTAHRVRWFWAAHVIHHSSQHYNLSTALRQTWTGFFAISFIFRLPLFFIGFPPLMVFFIVGLNLVYQFWIHTEVIGKMPRWFEAVMNTPSHHRVHHATNPRYLDSNYAGAFIIWDKMFGTFEPERDDETIRYGIVKNLGSFNLLWAAFHEWIGIGKDVWSAPWKHKLGYMVKPPGWSHDGSRDSSETIKERWREKQKQ